MGIFLFQKVVFFEQKVLTIDTEIHILISTKGGKAPKKKGKGPGRKKCLLTNVVTVEIFQGLFMTALKRLKKKCGNGAIFPLMNTLAMVAQSTGSIPVIYLLTLPAWTISKTPQPGWIAILATEPSRRRLCGVKNKKASLVEQNHEARVQGVLRKKGAYCPSMEPGSKLPGKNALQDKKNTVARQCQRAARSRAW